MISGRFCESGWFGEAVCFAEISEMISSERSVEPLSTIKISALSWLSAIASTSDSRHLRMLREELNERITQERSTGKLLFKQVQVSIRYTDSERLLDWVEFIYRKF